MADEKKIKFAGDASDLTSAFQRIKEEAKALNQGLIEDAMKYSDVSKKQIGYIQEQIKAIERRNQISQKETIADMEDTFSAKFKAASTPAKRESVTSQFKAELARVAKEQKQDDLQVKLLKDIVESIKTTAKEEIAADRKNAEDTAFTILNDKEGKYSDEEKFKAGVIQDLLGPGKNKLHFNENNEEEVKKNSSVFAALTADRIVKGIDKNLGLVIHAKSAEDIIKPAAGTLGMGVGATAGLAVEAATAGQIEATLLGADFGRILGDRFGDAYNRHIEESNTQQIARNRLSAITRQGGGIGSDFGMTQGQLMEYQNQIFRASFNQRDLIHRSRVSLGLERGYGVDQNTLTQGFYSEQFTGQSSMNNAASVVAALEKRGIISGDNRLPLGMFLQNQSQMINTFSQTLEKVNQDNAADMLLRFNKFGGGFDVADPMSLGRIQNIHNQLVNPNNDFTQAANFSVLRKTLGPNASFLDIMKAQEQGLGGEHGAEFMKNTLDMVAQRGGSKENQILSLRARFPGMTIEQAENMLSNREGFGGEQFKALADQERMVKQGQIIGEGTSRVTSIERDTAVIADAFAKGALEGIETVGELFIKKLESLLQEYVVKQVDQMLGAKQNNTRGLGGGSFRGGKGATTSW